jgi:hypothetical protein
MGADVRLAHAFLASAAMSPVAGKARAWRVHTARRVDRGAGCLAQRGAGRRASYSSGCGGPIREQDGRHDGGTGSAHSESCRPAGSALDPVSPAARRAETRSPHRGRRAIDSITQNNRPRIDP